MQYETPLKLMDLLPDMVTDWQAEKSVTLGSPSDLYPYMDGGAELYISYGFGAALSRTYTREGQPEVLAEVYDLLEPRNAFGVFTQTREDENQLYGQGTYTIPGAVFFWKSRYYISLSTWESTPETSDMISALAMHIDKMIPDTGTLPEVTLYMPDEGLTPYGYKYFHHPVWLNAYFFISDHNPFLIDKDCSAVLARYDDTGKRLYLLLVQFTDDPTAARAYAHFQKDFFPEGLTDSCVRLEDQTWLAASLSGNLIVSVFNGNSRESAHQLLVRTLDTYRLKTGI